LYKRISIVGLGNILIKDEGIGVWIVRELKKRNLPQGIEIIDGGTASLDIFLSMKNIHKLIIIDALKGGGKPGTVYRLYPRDLLATSEFSVSLHQMNVFDALSIAKKIRKIPQETVIIGVEPKEIDWGLGVTSDIKRKFPEITDIVLEEIENDCYRKEANY
jgi:hydrogenase maturation protease